MKTILSLIISGALVVSGYAQTRNVLVGTNNTVVQPTNFWSADASNARTGLGLGSAATNPASAFQPSSATLSNLASSNAVNLTNLRATNLVGVIPSSNIPSTTLTNISGTLAIVSGGTGATNASNARVNLGATTVGNNLFTATNAEAARNAIGTLATNGNAAGLTNLTAANITGTVGLASNVTGTIAISNGGTGATNAGQARTNLGLGNVGQFAFDNTNNAVYVLTNFVVTNNNTLLGSSSNYHAFFESTNTGFANNLGGVGYFHNGSNVWFVSTNNLEFSQPALVRNNLGVGSTNSVIFSNLTLSNGVITNLALVLGSTNRGFHATAGPDRVVTVVGGVGALSVFSNSIETGTGISLNVSGFGSFGTNVQIGGPLSFTGTNASGNAAVTRTNLGLPLPALTNTTNSEFNTAIGLGTTNKVQFNTVRVLGTGSPTNLGVLLGASNGVWGSAGPPSVGVGINGTTRLYVSETAITASAPIGFDNATNAATTRTNLGLGWSGLTNTNGTGLVAVNTNGEVVSPTNFWQVAPIVTRFVEFAPSTNATTNIVAARNLHIHSLALAITGVTSTIALPTTNSFNGDIALVVHQGPTSSVTAVRTAGATNNLVTMNQPEEAVEFVYYNSVWQFNHNLSYIEPIFFSGTNAAANAAASRTNLGLGNISMGSNGVVVATNFTATNGAARFTNLVTDYLEFGNNNGNLFIVGTNTNIIAFEEPVARTNFLHGLGLGPTNSVIFSNATIGNDTYIDSAGIRWGGNDRIQLEEMKLQGGNWEVDGGAFNVVGETNKATTRTNLGIPLAALTNTSNTNFQAAVFTTNAAPTNSANTNGINFNTAVRWMDVTLNISGTNQVFRIPLFQ